MAVPFDRPENAPSEHPGVQPRKVGVLLVNLGTPEAPEPGPVRRYLKEFLSDRRVVELPPLVWQPILRGAVLTTRPKKSAEAYGKVWMGEGSPLAVYTRRQAEKLAARMGDGVQVEWAMRYGNPAMAGRIEAMKAAGCERMLLAPLYPQYCAATTATVNDRAFAVLAKMRWQPALRTLPPYYDDPAHIAALASHTKASLDALDFVPDAVLCSFHGMPQRTLDLGDPYHCQCRKTARLLSDALGRELVVSFQSRFGKAKWLEPATDATLGRLAAEGVKKIAVVAPGFSVDCIETLEELDMQGREQFLAAGGSDFAYLPCLNASEPGMAMLETLIRRELSGWI